MSVRTTALVAGAIYASLALLPESALAQHRAQRRAAAPASAAAALDDRYYSTLDGSTGGLLVVDPGGGTPGALRLQLALGSVPADDFLGTGVEVAQHRKELSASWTALSSLELFAGLRDRSTADNSLDPSSLYAQSALIGAKVFGELHPALRIGGDLRAVLPGGVGEPSPVLKATSLGLRAAASLDLSRLSALPLWLRLNLEYLLDNSARSVERVEEQRYRSLDEPRARADETQHLISRIERYGLDISRVDRFTPSLGAEAKLAVARETYVHPIAELRLAVPVNRQGYDCALLQDASAQDDGCMSDAGFRAWPMHVSAGLRVAPPLRGLSLLLAVDVALHARDRYVRELAPSSPFVVSLGVAYAHDARPRRIRSHPRSFGEHGAAHAPRHASERAPRVPSSEPASGSVASDPAASPSAPELAAQPAVTEQLSEQPEPVEEPAPVEAPALVPPAPVPPANGLPTDSASPDELPPGAPVPVPVPVPVPSSQQP